MCHIMKQLLLPSILDTELRGSEVSQVLLLLTFLPALLNMSNILKIDVDVERTSVLFKDLFCCSLHVMFFFHAFIEKKI